MHHQASSGVIRRHQRQSVVITLERRGDLLEICEEVSGVDSVPSLWGGSVRAVVSACMQADSGQIVTAARDHNLNLDARS